MQIFFILLTTDLFPLCFFLPYHYLCVLPFPLSSKYSWYSRRLLTSLVCTQCLNSCTDSVAVEGSVLCPYVSSVPSIFACFQSILHKGRIYYVDSAARWKISSELCGLYNVREFDAWDFFHDYDRIHLARLRAISDQGTVALAHQHSLVAATCRI